MESNQPTYQPASIKTATLKIKQQLQITFNE